MMRKILLTLLAFIGIICHIEAQTSPAVNPILGGDYPDPTIVRVGQDYYMTHSSFNYQPGLAVLHSRDLVHWEAVSCALNHYLGSVWAPDISYYDNKFWIYFTVDTIGKPYATWMVQAENPEGPWSEPVRLETGHWIDPCHVVDAKTGERWLFLSGGYRIALNPEGTATTGDLEKVYDGWPIPEGWIYEGFALEGPKVKRVGDWYYLLCAEGGTAGPPTAHMGVIARSHNLKGPWENDPQNPLVHTYSGEETWWCRGHASLIDTPEGNWWLVEHAYRKNYVGLGRQTLLEPITWYQDWPVAPMKAHVDEPLPIQTSEPGKERPLSDWRIGLEWRFYKKYDPSRILENKNGRLILKAQGSNVEESAPLLMIAGDTNYELQVKATLEGDAKVGIVAFYNERFYAGIGYDTKSRFSWRRATKRAVTQQEGPKTIWLRLRNVDQVLIGFYSEDGEHWQKQSWGYEISGYNQNTAGEFQSLLPGFTAYGNGTICLEDFKYTKL